MKPPVNPEPEIDDPEDSKPVDWVDLKKIKDPSGSNLLTGMRMHPRKFD